ncbi:uncharacterized protein GGS25DRAFT_451298 [Hypoxylon fragiforme]|uniref:uncharacterized protein n=1 Tax=Hypoxylon fragiforme TaxID=63214 RepID=UPI0020C6BC3E|nr:uncharacterized protein GGS25DRAFT_451298 [Hypoxylon fragiforme]KAI2604191.1 hypothetical protein GGS25DRAFT_451298 [Hypoxylon fragiforme]
MRSLLSLTIALLGATTAVLAVPTPTPKLITESSSTTPTPVQITGAVDNSPDCASLEEYCKCKDDDFQCETNPSCEWCREHDAWPPASTTTATTTG